MEPNIACIPCIVRQGTDVVSRLADNGELKAHIIKDILLALSESDFNQPPPVTAAAIHRIIRSRLNSPDPYAESKILSNQLALSVLDEVRKRIDASDFPLGSALRIAATANIMDFAVHSEITSDMVLTRLEEAFNDPFDAALVRQFVKDVNDAKNIFYIADNAGEIVFDGLLMEYLPAGKVTVGVRGEPVLNDATVHDAESAGLISLCPVVNSGTDIPGTCLHLCSQSFQDAWNRSDLVIAKGQGNFETLAGCEKTIYFLFTAKCKVVADLAGVPIGTVMLHKNM